MHESFKAGIAPEGGEHRIDHQPGGGEIVRAFEEGFELIEGASEDEPVPASDAIGDPTVEASASEPRDPPSTRPADATRIIEKVASLRARGRYRAAADLLRRALRRPWERRTAEVLSYELGRILERQLDDDAAACAHWRKHDERFGGGRYADAVSRGLKRTCGE